MGKMLPKEMNLKENFNIDWAEEFNAAITICDTNATIIYMNQYSIRQFEKYGGAKLLGSNLLNCHPEPSKTQLKNMLTDHSENMSISEKNGVKTIYLQTPWKVDGEFRGIVEISFNLHKDLPVSLTK